MNNVYTFPSSNNFSAEYVAEKLFIKSLNLFVTRKPIPNEESLLKRQQQIISQYGDLLEQRLRATGVKDVGIRIQLIGQILPESDLKQSVRDTLKAFAEASEQLELIDQHSWTKTTDVARRYHLDPHELREYYLRSKSRNISDFDEDDFF